MKKGFTLIELLVVISIIGILIGLSVFGLSSARQSARDAKRKVDLESIRGGLELYKSDCDKYPIANILASTTLVGDNSNTSCPDTNVYISTIPTDPTTGTSDYKYVGTVSTYLICAFLEQAPNPAIDVTGCGSCGTSTCNYKVTNP